MARRSQYETVEQYLELSIIKLNRLGALIPGNHVITWGINGKKTSEAALRVTDEALRVSYCVHKQAESNVSHDIQLTTTPVHFGGTRSWFLCPDCNRRCGILYIDGQAIGCRQCLNLRYTSQREQPLDRAIRRQRKYKGSLDFKPKGMHWHTYDRLLQKTIEADQKMLQELGKQIEVLGLRISR